MAPIYVIPEFINGKHKGVVLTQEALGKIPPSIIDPSNQSIPTAALRTKL
ncbi:MAG: hypothetical protein PF541_18465 [Prolixibacteraceae bacterium]|nr:hypothetical protein [Prolixibacteraceae bacterium]